MTRLALVALVFVAACSEKDNVDRAACNAAAKADMERTAEYMAARGTANEHAKELDDPLMALTAKRCIEDKWPAEIVACYRKAPNYDDLLVCYSKLPEALQERLEQAQKELVLSVYGSGAAGSGMP